MHIKHIHDMMEKLTECTKMEFEKGIENVDTKEMGEVVDIIKDLAEAEYYAKISKAMDEAEYGEEYDLDGPMEDDKSKKGYRGQPRDSKGRYRSRRGGRRGYEIPMMMYEDWDDMEYMRDMDRPYGRMGYSGGGMSGGQSSGNTSGNSGNSSSMGNSGGGSRGYEEGRGGQYSSRMQRDEREGRSGEARRGYMESKETNGGNSAEEKQHKMKELENYMKELSTDVTEMIQGASPEEKTLLKQKMQVLMQKIQ